MYRFLSVNCNENDLPLYYIIDNGALQEYFSFFAEYFEAIPGETPYYICKFSVFIDITLIL